MPRKKQRKKKPVVVIGAAFIGFLVILLALIAFYANQEWSPSAKTSNNDSNIEQDQSSGDSPGSAQNQSDGTNAGDNQLEDADTAGLYRVGDKTPADTKQAIRSFFQSVNPRLIREIDDGQGKLDVLMGSMARMKLDELSERPDFHDFLSFQRTSTVVLAARHEQIGDFLNEVTDDGGMKTGITLYPTGALKNP